MLSAIRVVQSRKKSPMMFATLTTMTTAYERRPEVRPLLRTAELRGETCFFFFFFLILFLELESTYNVPNYLILPHNFNMKCIVNLDIANDVTCMRQSVITHVVI